MFKILLYGFLLYLLYKFIFELLIPVSKATVEVKQKLREMQEQQNAQQRQYEQQRAYTPTPTAAATTKKEDDYIEFEEVK